MDGTRVIVLRDGTTTIEPPTASAEVAVPAPGRRFSASTTTRATRAIPANSARARRSRWKGYETWCRRESVRRDPTERGALPDYMAHLADLAHPASTLQSVLGTLTSMLAVAGHPLDAEDTHTARLVVTDRAREEAADPRVRPGPVKAVPMGVAHLRCALATLDRTTARGIRDATVLTLDWYMAGRSSEPAGLNLHDVEEAVAAVPDPRTGEVVGVAALLIHVRMSKTDTRAKGSTTRVLAQPDPDLCPVRAIRAWKALLAEHDQDTPGPLIRRIDRHGRIGDAAGGRRPKDPHRAAGVTAETIRTIITTAAGNARLAPEPDDAERDAAERARAREDIALAAAATDAERDAVLAARRRRLRAAAHTWRRFTGHSMRHGFVMESLNAGHSPEAVARQGRWTPGSRSFRERYVPENADDWTANSTRGLGQDNPTAL